MQQNLILKKGTLLPGCHCDFPPMLPQDKKKYLIPGAVATLVLVTVVTVALVIISKRSDKVDAVKTDPQTKELKDDPCEVLLKVYLKALESKADKAKLSKLYSEGRAKCPKDFPEPAPQEEPKVEDIRARVAQKEAEKKVGGVNKPEGSVNKTEGSVNKTEGGVSKAEKSTSNTATETVSSDTKQVDASDSGSKGSIGAADPSKPATVPQPKSTTSEIKNNTTETKNNTNQTINTTKEVQKSDDKTKQQPDLKPPKGPGADEKQPNGTPDTTGEQQGDTTGKQNDAPPNPPVTTIITKTPKELKEERAGAKSECIQLMNNLLKKENSNTATNSFLVRIEELFTQGLLPKAYNVALFVMDFVYGEVLKHFKSGDIAKAQEVRKAILSRFSLFTEEDLTLSDDCKFWKAINSDNWVGAKALLDKPLYLPFFIRDAMKKDDGKLKLLKELNDAQMDALWEYCIWNKEREKWLGQYGSTGNEWEMAEAKAEYSKAAEKMSLLNEDIHKDFDFAVPVFVDKKSYMQELDEKLKNKTPAFEAAFEKLRKSRNLGMPLVLGAMYELDKREDQVELLETVKKLKLAPAEISLIEILLKLAHKEQVDTNIVVYLTSADYQNAQHLTAINEALKRLHSSGGSQLDLARLDFWKLFISLVQDLKTRLGKQNTAYFTTFKDELREIATEKSPFNIQFLGGKLSDFSIGAEGSALVKQCAVCIQTRSDLNPTDAVFKAEHEYAHAYLQIYIAVNGVKMFELQASGDPSKEFFQALDPQLVANYFQSEEKLYAANNKKYDSSFRNDIIPIVNTEFIVALEKKLGETGADTAEEGFKDFSLIWKVSSHNKSVVLKLLKVHPINKLIESLRVNFGCDYKPAPVTQVTLAQVTNLLDSFLSQITDKEAENKFLEAAEKYSLVRQQEILNEVRTSLRK